MTFRPAVAAAACAATLLAACGATSPPAKIERARVAMGSELRLTWLGAMRILERLEASGFDVVRHRPALGLADGPALMWQLLTWRIRP